MPSARLGYLLTALSAACSALNGSLARYLLDGGMSAARLSQLRSAVSFALLALALGVAVIGTLVPFLLLVTALRHLPAPRVAVVAMLEPVLASILAWAIHDQALSTTQIAGGAVVLAAIAWLQAHRPTAAEVVG